MKRVIKNPQMLYLSGSEGEPALGFEPRTYGLQNRCTTTVLCRRRLGRIYIYCRFLGLNQALSFLNSCELRRAAPGKISHDTIVPLKLDFAV